VSKEKVQQGIKLRSPCALSVCAATDGSGDNTGPSTACTSGFCRYSRCSNPPATPLGGQCTTGDDCEGMGYSGTARIAVECGSNRCGGEGAACFADQGGPRGASVMCASGERCLIDMKVWPTVADGFLSRPLRWIRLHRSQRQPGAEEARWRRPGTFTCRAPPGLPCRSDPLPSLSQRFRGTFVCGKVFPTCWCLSLTLVYVRKCVDVNDVETCGGCIGEHLPGRDCTAIVGVDSVECRKGACKISTSLGMWRCVVRQVD
jgi:hypothetical protein